MRVGLPHDMILLLRYSLIPEFPRKLPCPTSFHCIFCLEAKLPRLTNWLAGWTRSIVWKSLDCEAGWSLRCFSLARPVSSALPGTVFVFAKMMP